MNDLTMSSLQELEALYEDRRNDSWQILSEIWARKLYAKEYKNFEKYLNERWGISKSTAYRHVTKFLPEPALQAKNATNVSKGTKSSKSGQKSTSDKENGDTETETDIIEAEFEVKDVELLKYKDHEGHKLTGDMAKLFVKYDAILRPISNLINELQAKIAEVMDADKMMTPKDPILAKFKYSNFVKIHIWNQKKDVKCGRPWAICLQCGGDGGVDKSCTTCKGRGWLYFMQYNALPKKLKDDWETK